jgi:hypothetical protein
MSRKYTLLHVIGAFALGIATGALAVTKGCPPVPAPAGQPAQPKPQIVEPPAPPPVAAEAK